MDANWIVKMMLGLKGLNANVFPTALGSIGPSGAAMNLNGYAAGGA